MFSRYVRPLKVFLIVALLLNAHVSLWAQSETEVETEEEVELDDGDFSASDTNASEEETSDGDEFADFDESAPAESDDALEPAPAEEMIVEDPGTPIEEVPMVPEGETEIAEPPSDAIEPTPEPGAEASPDFVATTDEPDLEYEARLYNIYVNFHSQQTSQEQWSALIGERQAESYRIQSGDTLWGISKTLFGDGNYWPKVWSLNGGISNPHLITPGHSIRFVLGDESDAPAFTVTENDDKSSLPDGPLVASNTQTSVSSEIDIPEPEYVSRPVVMRLPPSLPEWTSQDRGGNYDSYGIDYGRRPILEVKDPLPLSAYITEAPAVGIGKVEEIETGAATASTFQYVYLQVQKGTAQVGEELLVIKDRGALRPANYEVPRNLGFAVEIQAKIKLVDKVRSQSELEMYRAIVLRTLSPVEVGSILAKGEIETLELSSNGPRSDVVAQIVGGNYDESRQMFGPQSLAFLNRGSNDGLAVGQVLPIRSNRRVRNPNTLVDENIVPIGYLQIVRVERNVATAVILRVWDHIHQGDVTGEGGYMSSTPSEVQDALEEKELLEPTEEAPPEAEAADEIDELDDLSGAGDTPVEATPAEPSPTTDKGTPQGGDDSDEELELEEL